MRRVWERASAEERERFLADVGAKQLAVAATPKPNAEPVDVGLSMNAKQKLDAALRAEKQRLQRDAEAMAEADGERRFEEYYIPSYLRRVREVEFTEERSDKGVMPKAKFNTILRCLHPDNRKSWTDKQFDEAFDTFNGYRAKLISDDDAGAETGGQRPAESREELLVQKARKDGKAAPTVIVSLRLSAEAVAKFKNASPYDWRARMNEALR